MIFTVRPLPCNYCVNALCLHGTNLTHLHACVKVKGGTLNTVCRKKPLINSD